MIDASGIENLRDRVHEASRRPGGALSDALVRRVLQVSPILFARVILRGPEYAPFFGRYNYGPAHLRWDWIMRNKRRFCVAASRGSGKSWAFTIAWALHCMFFNIRRSFLSVSSTDENCKRVLREIREEIEGNPLLHWLYPKRSTGRTWHAHDLIATNGFPLMSRSLFTAMRGLHPGTISCDDIMTDKARYSGAYRAEVSNAYFSVISNMMMPDCHLGLTGTVFSTDDLIIGELSKNAEYHYEKFPILNERGESLWPELLPIDAIESIRREQGSVRFACERLCNPISDQMSLIPKSLFMAEPQEQRLFKMGTPLADLKVLGLRMFIGVDFAFSGATNADWFVIMVLGLDRLGNRWIVDMERHRGLGMQAQLSMMTTVGRRYQPEVMLLESNQAQRIMGAEMRRTTDLPIRDHHTSGLKHHLEHGVPALGILAENGKFRVPRGDINSVEKTDIMMDELANCTFDKGRVVSTGGHDDTVFGLYLANEAIKLAGQYAFHFPDQEVPPHAQQAVRHGVPADVAMTSKADIMSGINRLR